MSDIMLLGVLRMPFDTKGDLHLIQLQSRCHEAADRIENDAATIASLREEVERLRKELAEWEASRNHMIDIIHDSTAPLLARLEAAEHEVAVYKGTLNERERELNSVHSRLEAAEGKVEKVREWVYNNMEWAKLHGLDEDNLGELEQILK